MEYLILTILITFAGLLLITIYSLCVIASTAEKNAGYHEGEPYE